MAEINKQVNKKPIYPTLKRMEVGEEVVFPLSRFTVVKATCSIVKRERGVVFKTKTAAPDFIVTRVK